MPEGALILTCVSRQPACENKIMAGLLPSGLSLIDVSIDRRSLTDKQNTFSYPHIPRFPQMAPERQENCFPGRWRAICGGTANQIAPRRLCSER
jgi:hypothetical protein